MHDTITTLLLIIFNINIQISSASKIFIFFIIHFFHYAVKEVAQSGSAQCVWIYFNCFHILPVTILISFSFWMTPQFILKVSFKFWGRNVSIYLQGFTFYNGVYKIIFFYKIYFKKSYHAFACLRMVQWSFALSLCIFLNTVRLAWEAWFEFFLEERFAGGIVPFLRHHSGDPQRLLLLFGDAEIDLSCLGTSIWCPIMMVAIEISPRCLSSL